MQIMQVLLRVETAAARLPEGSGGGEHEELVGMPGYRVARRRLVRPCRVLRSLSFVIIKQTRQLFAFRILLSRANLSCCSGY
jgi:hypothetical protein